MTGDMAEPEGSNLRGEAEGALSPGDPQPSHRRALDQTTCDSQTLLGTFKKEDDAFIDEEERTSGRLWDEETGRGETRTERFGPTPDAVPIKDIALNCDPLAEAAMNILRTHKQQDDLEITDQAKDTDNTFVDFGDSDGISSAKHPKQSADCRPQERSDIFDQQRSEEFAKKLNDLRIDIPDPAVKLKRRSSSIAELSDAEATGSMERFSPREDPVGSVMGSLPLHGTLTREGEMVSYVADDLTEKIRQSVGSSCSNSGQSTPAYPSTTQLKPPWAATPTSMTSSSSSTTELGSSASTSLIPPIDPDAVQDLERQCHRVADNLNLMLGHLSNSLHNMSAITVGHIQTYRDAVEKAGITVDKSVKEMYALMAKVEELNFSMPVVYELAKQIKDINSRLDELENLCK